MSDGVYSVFHHISNVETFFSRQAIGEVIAGVRSPWDGDIEGLAV
ncbi:hypothetical protein [Naasia lichenicola]|nr:hypothetical protein [Naasia lichenicola]